ncbi:MAG: hydrogenase maturation protease [Anaerolineae bacterium]|nr:hydrogenase maturation protease [Anaerolineae bacterium]
MGDAPDATHDTLILGVGNPLLGDDAIGVLAAQALQQRDDLPPHVTVIDGGTDGLGLIPVMEEYRRVILVDAVPMELEPGTIRRFTWAEIKLNLRERLFSLHETGVTEALVLAETLNCLPPKVVFYGVQPHNMEWDQPMSEAVQRALPALLEALIHEVRSNN